MFTFSYSKKYTLLNLIFGKYLEPQKELTRFAWSKPCKNVGLVYPLAIFHDFHGLKLSYLFFYFQRLLSKK